MDIESYYDKIYKYIYFKVNNKNLAEDLTQETFLRYLKSECNEPERYLYTIAGNLCIDEYRRIKPVFTEDEDITQVTSFDELPENAKNYINRIEEITNTPVKFIGTGAGREDIIVR